MQPLVCVACSHTHLGRAQASPLLNLPCVHFPSPAALGRPIPSCTRLRIPSGLCSGSPRNTLPPLLWMCEMLGVLQDRYLHIYKYRYLRYHVSKYVQYVVGKYMFAYMTSRTCQTARHFRVSSYEHRVSTLRVLELVT